MVLNSEGYNFTKLSNSEKTLRLLGSSFQCFLGEEPSQFFSPKEREASPLDLAIWLSGCIQLITDRTWGAPCLWTDRASGVSGSTHFFRDLSGSCTTFHQPRPPSFFPSTPETRSPSASISHAITAKPSSTQLRRQWRRHRRASGSPRPAGHAGSRRSRYARRSHLRNSQGGQGN